MANRLKLGLAAALIASAGALVSLPAQAFWWPWSGGGPWYGGNPWYGGYAPYYGGYSPYYAAYPYYGGHYPYYGYPHGGYAYPYTGYYPYQSAPAQSSSSN
jgi:hypothetical protein